MVKSDVDIATGLMRFVAVQRPTHASREVANHNRGGARVLGNDLRERVPHVIDRIIRGPCIIWPSDYVAVSRGKSVAGK